MFPHIFLQNDTVRLIPLKEADFEELYAVASDPLIWEQHPNKNRYQREVFKTFFEGAIQSGGAYKITDAETGEVVGSSRFYDHDEKKRTVLIGYTFISRSSWGKGINRSSKELMMQHAFNFVDKVIFHVGAENIRSQKAMEKLGAEKIDEQIVSYHGEDEKLNFVYRIRKEDFKRLFPR